MKNFKVIEYIGLHRAWAKVHGKDFAAVGNNPQQAMRNLVRVMEKEMSEAQKLADALDKVADRIWNKI